MLVPNLEVVRHFEDEDYHRLGQQRLISSLLLVDDSVLDEVLHDTERTKVLLV